MTLKPPLPSHKYSCSTYPQVSVKKACLAADALSKFYEKKSINHITCKMFCVKFIGMIMKKTLVSFLMLDDRRGLL